MSIQKQDFGVTPKGQAASLYTITNGDGTSVSLSDFGARIVSIVVPDKNGVLGDVALGYKDAQAYTQQGRYCGAICGRFANRLRAARFCLDKTEYTLAKNDGNNTLHGGKEGYDMKLWHASPSPNGDAITFSLLSPDGEEGYPGNLMMTVVYTFTSNHALSIEYKAVSDKETIINLTNHAYFNLQGHNTGAVENHLMQINASFFTPIDEEILPTGEIRPVEGTAFDFKKPTAIGLRADDADVQLQRAGGYDHNFVLDKTGRDALECAAVVTEPKTGRVMEVYTTKPGIQLYGGNFMKDFEGKDEATYTYREGFCLETQYFPNSVDVTHFPTPVVLAGQMYLHTTEYRFSTVK